MRHKTSSCEAPLYVFLRHRSGPGLTEGVEELEFSDVGDTCTDQVLNLATVRLLQRAKTANAKWLEVVGGIYRHTERKDIIFLAVNLK